MPEDPEDLRKDLAEARARLAAVEARNGELEHRLLALEQRPPAKVELGDEFDGIRELSYHLKHGGLTPFLADRAWWPNLGTHIMWAMIALIAFAVIGYTLDEVLGII